MTTKKTLAIRIVVLALLVFLVGATVASASHINGIRITQTGGTGLDVDIDVSVFYTVSSTNYTTAYVGYSTYAPAIDWGDGATVPYYGYGPSTGIPLVATSTVVNGVPARAYRGSFSHTYPSPAAYTITAWTTCCAVTTPTYPVATGSVTTSSLVFNTLNVVAGGVASGIPTLSSPGLVLLASMMVLIALVVLRRQGSVTR